MRFDGFEDERMPMHFTVLASGSGGNASLLEVDGFGVLIDVGLGPRVLAARMAAIGASWQRVRAVLLTHTHGDHWSDPTFTHLRRLQIPLYCYGEHEASLLGYSAALPALKAANLVRPYKVDGELSLAPTLFCKPLPLSHDGGGSFGFRFEVRGDLFGNGPCLGYASDLGSWTPELAQALADVNVLALEFNHDVDMEMLSGRAPQLIARVLGDHGHLSNAQAAALLREVLNRSTPGRLQHVVQLHLSRQCNCPSLAATTARAIFVDDGHGIEVHTASQDKPGPRLNVGGTLNGKRHGAQGASRARQTGTAQPWLPGLEG